MKVTCIGAALVDLFFSSEQFKREERPEGAFLCQHYGQKIEIETYKLTTGGGATNTAVAFARRGHDVSIVAEIGRDDFGQIVRNELIAEKIDTRQMIRERKEQTGCSVILRGLDEERTVMVSRAASSLLDDYDINIDYLKQRDWIHLSSIAGNLNALSEIWQVFEKKTVGLSWNPGKKELEQLTSGALNLPIANHSVFIVNEEEWQLVANKQKEILTTFEMVLITKGSQGGAVFYQGKKQADFAALVKEKALIVDTTGAGDAFASAFVSTLLYGCTINEAIQAGNNNAASVIKHLGAKQGLLSF